MRPEASALAATLEHVRPSLHAIADAGLRWETRLDARRSTMPAGNNGPYVHLESPVRNTAHWLVTYAILHRLTGDERYRDVGRRLAAFLLEPGPYRLKHGLIHRQTLRLDWCNGVIGPAWVIEALVRASRYLGVEEALPAARAIAAAHVYAEAGAVWHRCDPRFGTISIDYTYNHQAWLAAALQDLEQRDHAPVRAFLDRSDSFSLRVAPTGRIDHLLYDVSVKNLVNRAAHKRAKAFKPDKAVEKENGYHLYVLHPLARLAFAYPEHPLFRSGKLSAALRYCTAAFFAGLETNRYAYAYNAPGLELPLVYAAFGGQLPLTPRDVQAVVDRQLALTKDPDTGLLTRATPDPYTLTARAYELALAVEACQIA
jgi:hypothetical protein